MIRFIVLTISLLLIASSAWSFYINDGGYVDVGELDIYLASATQEDVGGSSGDAEELNWINTTLFGLGLISSYYTDTDFDKIETDDGAGWLQAYSTPGVVADYTFAYNLVTSEGETLYPDYFLVKTGNLRDDVDYRWFLFQNNELLDWAVINLQEQGYSLLEIGKISHIDNVGGAAPVPEPATMILLGSGLIGLAGIRRKLASKDCSGKTIL
ncbi:MAG TPA: PEP-CTERM sorting domain-containing protein [Deltaproteobacteria bacterium]|nr:PEP-CTERM sorting domain-containing protein [Deltaproteobacteria bacterium]